MTTNMDAGASSEENFALNFDLLGDDFQLIDPENIVDVSKELPEDIVTFLKSIEEGETSKNEADSEVFESKVSKQRFKVVTQRDLDEIASENNAQATHWQTNWAVNVLRGW